MLLNSTEGSDWFRSHDILRLRLPRIAEGEYHYVIAYCDSISYAEG